MQDNDRISSMAEVGIKKPALLEWAAVYVCAGSQSSRLFKLLKLLRATIFLSVTWDLNQSKADPDAHAACEP